MQTIQRSLTFRLAYGVTFVPPKIFAYERRASCCVTESYCQTPSEVYGLHAANFVFSFYLWANCSPAAMLCQKPKAKKNVFSRRIIVAKGNVEI